MIERFDWLIRWLSALLASILFSISLDSTPLTSQAYLMVNYGLFATLSCYILLPTPKNSANLLLNTMAAVLLLIIITQFPLAGTSTEKIPVAILFQVCLVVLSLSLVLWSLNQLLETKFSKVAHGRNFILLFIVIMSATPIWLGPLVDLHLPENNIINSIISITPLSHFSIAAEYDYLRSEWFYRNTPFGSLPFTYPELSIILVSYFLLVFLLQTILWILRRNSRYPIP